MTTEIAILNRQGIALASDSAVTVGRQRVWKTANKLFSLAPNNDIAIMTFGGGDFLSFPWETIVKSFRLEVAKDQYDTVEECASEFIEYICSQKFSNERAEQISVMLLFIHLLETVKGHQKQSLKRKRLNGWQFLENL